MGDLVKDEVTPLLPGRHESPSWTGKSIASLKFYSKSPIYFRADALPFVFLYSALFSVWVVGYSPSFTVSVLLAVTVTLHVLMFLLQYWSLRARAFLSYSRVTSLENEDIDEGLVYALVRPQVHRGKPEMILLKVSESGCIYFGFQKRTYVYSVESNLFEKVLYPTNLPVSTYMSAAKASQACTDEDTNVRLFKYGRNVLEMPLPTFMELYKQHLLAPFFVFQIFSILLWLLEDHVQYCIMTMSMMFLFEATVAHGRLRSLREIRGMRNKPRLINVWRDRKWTGISTLDLLPGDIVSICRSQDDSDVVPCDVLLLGGSAVINEAMLTGESVPLMKEALRPLTDAERSRELSVDEFHKSNVLFGGTKVLTTGEGGDPDAVPSVKPPDSGCVGYVLRTGFGSSQGKLMRTILFSTENVSANSWEAALFLLFLLIFALLASGYVLYYRYEQDEGTRSKLLLRCVLIITSVVPPELPMQLALAVHTSLISLVKAQVFCTEPFRIPFAGKIDVCCFDKTGTLTSDTINAAGVALPQEQAVEIKSKATEKQEVEVSESQCTEQSENMNPLEYPLTPVVFASKDASMVLAACHSLVYVDNDLVGDPLELAALEAVEWNYGKSGTCVPKRGGASAISCRILQRFRFASELRRMSVIVQVTGDNVQSGPRVLTKGAPGAIAKLLKDGVLPKGFEESSRALARRGMRVLALAVKDLDESLTASQLGKLSRDEAESGLTFVGFVCFDCPLRDDSRKVIRTLKKANHRTMMITGDATLTAAHVATQVGMATRSVLILEQSTIQPGTLEWMSASTGHRKKKFSPDKIPELAEQYDLCVSGPALEDAISNFSAMKKYLHYIKVFARMSPDQKEMVITSMKDGGLHTLMCGDGTNDVGALKQAHVGVALLSTVNTSGDATLNQIVGGSGKKSNAAQIRSSQPVPSATPAKTSQSSVRQRKSTKSSKSAPKPGPSATQQPRQKTQKETHRTFMEKKMAELQESLAEADDQAPLVKLGDASIASPFTSRRMTIDCCTSVIRQGRCTLATTMQMYQILALNCLISAYSMSVLYLEGISLGDRQMTIVGLIMALAFFMISRSKPMKKLSPERPASSIFSPSLFLSLLAQFAVHVFAQVKCVKLAKFYLPEDYVVDVDAEFAPTIVNTAVFLLSVAQQISVFIVNYKGRPFMEGLYDNAGLRMSLLAVTALVGMCTAGVSEDLNKLMELVAWPAFDLQLQVAGLIAVNMVAASVVDFVIRKIFSRRVSTVQ